jgi:phenylalanyl-tRNA synthetase beta chain
MKTSVNWLKEFVEFDLPPDELAHSLTMAGFEVEAIETIDDDVIFDIGVTPNRPDCLSIRGIAREISAILEVPFKDIPVKINDIKGPGPAVEIENKTLCKRYSSRIISGVKTGSSPDWLKKRLESCGIRSTSSIVDITNLVLLETGQPMHAFDLDKLDGPKIVVKQADGLDRITTLDNEERPISEEMLLIWDAAKPVAIAGIMGGKDTEVSESTVNVLLESAYFNPSSVRSTSKSLNLSTESSYRFERGVDIEAVTPALDRAAQLIEDIAGGKISELTDANPETVKPRKISLSINKIGALIGIDIDESFINKTLMKLGFSPKLTGDTMEVTIPSFRNDVEMDVDIVEEIARLYGYDKIPSTLPVMNMSAAPEQKIHNLIKTIKNLMVKSGFSEAINFSFLNPDVLDKLSLPDEDRRRNLVYIKNPLRKEESAMRTTLVPALLNNLITNMNRGEKDLRLFEISNVFLKSDNNKLPDETVQAVAVYHKEEGACIWKTSHEGFYDLKGVFENMFSALKIPDIAYDQDTAAPEPYMHPGKSCYITFGGKRIGAIGILHPGIADEFGIDGYTVITELYDLEEIFNAIPPSTTYVPLPKFPFVERDIALIVTDDITVSAVKKEILGIQSGIIESITLFDIYKGKPIPPDKKSLAFSIRFRSADKTLTDNEVDDQHSLIVKRLKDKLKAELR